MNTFWDSLLGNTSGPNLEDFISDFEKAEVRGNAKSLDQTAVPTSLAGGSGSR